MDITKYVPTHHQKSSVAWAIAGKVALAAMAALVIANIPDIRRYIRISTM